MTIEQEKIKNRIFSGSLNIARIPLQVRTKFIEYARDNFCNDYGMAFKSICDKYFEDNFALEKIVLDKLAEFEMRIEKLEGE